MIALLLATAAAWGHAPDVQPVVFGVDASVRAVWTIGRVGTWAMVEESPHGPDGPDGMPDQGYAFRSSNKKHIPLKLAGGTAVLGLIAAGQAATQNAAMRDATTRSELDAAYGKQRVWGTASYTLLGASVALTALDIAL